MQYLCQYTLYSTFVSIHCTVPLSVYIIQYLVSIHYKYLCQYTLYSTFVSIHYTVPCQYTLYSTFVSIHYTVPLSVYIVQYLCQYTLHSTFVSIHYTVPLSVYIIQYPCQYILYSTFVSSRGQIFHHGCYLKGKIKIVNSNANHLDQCRKLTAAKGTPKLIQWSLS